jgi:hypothetical protein
VVVLAGKVREVLDEYHGQRNQQVERFHESYKA